MESKGGHNGARACTSPSAAPLTVLLGPSPRIVRRKISALNAALDHLRSLKSAPGLSLDSAKICDQKISEVLAWKTEIEHKPDFPLAHDMNKYMARATSAIGPRRSTQPSDASQVDSACFPPGLDVPVAKRIRT